ncbi:MAG: GNAT family N-acetyltransferase [Marmoricola sp.]
MTELRMIGPDDWRDWRDIRLRALADAPSAFGSVLAREQDFTEADWRQRTSCSVLVYDEGVPVAMGAGFENEPGQLMVVAMWTEPDRRGQGLGGRVLDEIVSMARSLDVVPHLFVMRANPEAGRLYERHGFVRSGHLEDHGGREAEQLVFQADP